MSDKFARIAKRLGKECVERGIITESEFYSDKAANILKEEFKPLIHAAVAILKKFTGGETYVSFKEAANLRDELEKWR